MQRTRAAVKKERIDITKSWNRKGLMVPEKFPKIVSALASEFTQ
jgi:hypothetical protein